MKISTLIIPLELFYNENFLVFPFFSLSFLQDNSNNFTSHSANDRSTSQQIRSAFVCRPSATAKVSFRIFSQKNFHLLLRAKEIFPISVETFSTHRKSSFSEENFV